MDTPTQQAPAHQFPTWPMNCLTFYCHLADDYGRFLQRVGGAADPVQATRAEGDLGVSLMHDMAQAWYDLALSPITAMAKVATSGPAPDDSELARPPVDRPAKTA